MRGCTLRPRIQEPPGPRPASGLGGRGGVGSTPAPLPRGPAAVTRPPSRSPSPSCPLPAPPAPGALTWKRFFTHSFFMAGEGARRAAGRGGDGRGRGGAGVGGGAGGERGCGREPALVEEGASGQREPRRGWRVGKAVAAAPRARPSPSSPRPTWRPFPASPGAAVTCFPAPLPRICLPGPGHMGKLRHRKRFNGPHERSGHSLIGSPMRPPRHPLPPLAGPLWKVSASPLAHSTNLRTWTLCQAVPNWPVAGARRRPQHRGWAPRSYTRQGSSWVGAPVTWPQILKNPRPLGKAKEGS